MLGMALLTVGSCKKESRNNAVTWSSNPHLAIVKWYKFKFISADKGRAAIKPEANSHYLIYFRTVGKCVIRVRTAICPRRCVTGSPGIIVKEDFTIQLPVVLVNKWGPRVSSV